MFGEQLKMARNEKSISQKELSTLIKVSQQTVGSWETNRTSPSPEMVKLIAQTLDISTDYLLGNGEVKVSDVKLDEIEFALFGEVRELDEETKNDILTYAKFKRQQKMQKEKN